MFRIFNKNTFSEEKTLVEIEIRLSETYTNAHKDLLVKQLKAFTNN